MLSDKHFLVELLSTALSPNDAVLMLQQEVARRFVEIDVQGFTMVSATAGVIRGTPYTAPTSKPAPNDVDANASGDADGSKSSLIPAIGGGVGGLLVIVLVLVLVKRQQQKQTAQASVKVSLHRLKVYP